MHLAEAYRSLARPSSALEPSHPLTGMSSLVPHTLSERLVAKPMHDFYDLVFCLDIGLHPSPPSLSLGGALKWTCWDSDPGPPPCKGGALPTELQAQQIL